MVHTVESLARSAARTVGERLREQVRADPGRRFLTVEDTVYTYAEFDRVTDDRARGFRDLGVDKGDTVCQMMPNSPEFLVNWIALAKLGAVEVGVNTEFVGDALARMINLTGARVVVADGSLFRSLIDVADRLETVSQLLYLGDADPGELAALGHLQPRPLRDVDVRGPQLELAPVGLADPLMVIFTSGTTGPSKGVEISHAYALHFSSEMIHHWELTPDDVLFSAYPLFHAEASILTFLTALHAGASCVVQRRFSVSGFWDTVREHGVTYTTLMGAIMTFLWKAPERPDDRDNPLRIVCGAPTPSFFPEFEKRFGVKVVECFGATECCHPIHDDLHGEHRDGAVGRPCEHHEVRIGDDLDAEVPEGTVGEILVRHRQPLSGMTRYYGNPEATVEATRNLWYHTGDLGIRDADGYIRFVGRKKDSIRRRGKNISSFEIEEVLDRHPLVLESAAVGVPSEYTEDDVKCYLVTRADVAGSGIDPLEVHRWTEARLPNYARPRYIEVVAELPKSSTGKVQKVALRESWRTPGTFDVETLEYLRGETVR